MDKNKLAFLVFSDSLYSFKSYNDVVDLFQGMNFNN